MRADDRDHVGRVGGRRRERADGVEADGRAADVLGEQGIEPGWLLVGGQGVQRRDLVGRERRARRRVVEGERSLDAIDALDRVELRAVGGERGDRFGAAVGSPVTSARMMIGVVSPGANSVWSAT